MVDLSAKKVKVCIWKAASVCVAEFEAKWLLGHIEKSELVRGGGGAISSNGILGLGACDKEQDD